MPPRLIFAGQFSQLNKHFLWSLGLLLKPPQGRDAPKNAAVRSKTHAAYIFVSTKLISRFLFS